MNTALVSAATLIGRLLMSAIFIWSGYGKLAAYAATGAYMQKMGVPDQLLPLVIAVELGGGLLLAIGFQTRLVVILLASFTLLAGLLFHLQLGDLNQMNHLMKNVAIIGGFLMVFVTGAGAWSVDGRRARH